MSYILDPIQNCLETIVSKSTAEICLNSLLGVAAGYLFMRFAKSSALIAGATLLAVELVSENSSVLVDNGSTFEKYLQMFLQSFAIDEIYRRCAARGFLGGVLIGMSLD